MRPGQRSARILDPDLPAHRQQWAGRAARPGPAVQTNLPNGTSRSLISTQYRSGRTVASAAAVFSGVDVVT